MRLATIILLLALSAFSYGQDTTAHHGSIKLKKKYVEADYWPRIAGKLNGTISSAELCHPKGIYTVYPMEIKSFELHCSYLKDGILKARGHELSDEMCKLVTALPSNAIVHFQNIVAIDDKGRELKLNSLRYTINNPPKKNP